MTFFQLFVLWWVFAYLLSNPWFVRKAFINESLGKVGDEVFIQKGKIEFYGIITEIKHRDFPFASLYTIEVKNLGELEGIHERFIKTTENKFEYE